MKDCNDTGTCIRRREFLVKAGFAAGSVVLTVSALSSGGIAAVLGDVTVTIGPDSPLNKVGGFQIVQSPAGKLIVIHSETDKFEVFSAKCTHRGATVEYDAAAKQIHCPRHGSRFDPETGNVVKGPAKNPLPSFPTDVSGQTVTIKAG